MSRPYSTRRLIKKLKVAQALGESAHSLTAFEPFGFMDTSKEKILFRCSISQPPSFSSRSKLLDIHTRLVGIMTRMGYTVIDNGSWSNTNFDVNVSSMFKTGAVIICGTNDSGIFVSVISTGRPNAFRRKFSFFLLPDTLNRLDDDRLKAILVFSGVLGTP